MRACAKQHKTRRITNNIQNNIKNSALLTTFQSSIRLETVFKTT